MQTVLRGMTMSEILSVEEFDDILIAMRRQSAAIDAGRTAEERAEHRDKALEAHKAAFAVYRAALARIEAPPVPECPWPVDVWPMTDAEYSEAVPDEGQRTAISGFLMRRGWELCVKALERAAADSTLDELAEKQGVGPATRESLTASLGCIPDAPLHGLDAEQAEQWISK